MSKFTFLTKEQCVGPQQLEVLRKRGTRAAITDFAILLGGYVSDFYLDNDTSLEGKTGLYWTRTDDRDCDACMVGANGSIYAADVSERYVGARPALPFSSISKIPTNEVSGSHVVDGVKEVEYGYYPQRAADKRMQKNLETAFLSRSLLFYHFHLKKTGNGYTTDSAKYNWYGIPFQKQRHEEYEYDGKRYVRVQAKPNAICQECALSNGETYREGDVVWVEVEPVRWIVDEREKIMLSDKILFAGVPFNEKRNYRTKNFDITNINKFMERNFSKDLTQERIAGYGQVLEKKENPYKFDFGEVNETDIIKGALESNVSIFLHGKSRCGKSDRVKKLDPDFIELNLSHLTPELLDGLAGEKDGKRVHIKPPWLEELENKCQEEPNKIHILFLEELTNESPMMKSKVYGIALDKKVAGRWKLPEQARVVVAGNEMEESLVENEKAETLYDSFAHVQIETTVESWLKWAVTPENSYERLDYHAPEKERNKIHPAIYAFISYKGEEALRTPYNRERPKPHADPRRWKMASDMLYASNKPWTLLAIIGEELTRDFIDFCQVPTITVQDVLDKNCRPEDLADMDMGRKMATVTALLSVDSENMPKIRKFLKQLQGGDELCAKFDVQWTHGDEKRLEQLQEAKLEEQLEEQER